MKKVVYFLFGVVAVIILVSVLLLLDENIEEIRAFFNIDWAIDLSKDIEAIEFVAHNVVIPEYRIMMEKDNFYSFSNNEVDIPMTSTEVACLIAQQIRKDFEKYDMSDNHNGYSLSPFDDDYEIISPGNLNPGKDSTVSGIGSFRIKIRLPTSVLDRHNILYNKSRTIEKVDEDFNVVETFVNFEDIEHDTIPTSGSGKTDFEGNAEYWKYEDLPFDVQKDVKDRCTDLPIFFTPCSTEFVDEECVTYMLKNMRVGNRYFCTGINEENSRYFTIEGKSDRLFFGNEKFTSKKSGGIRSEKNICPRGDEGDVSSGDYDMISVWSAYESNGENKCSEYNSIDGKMSSDGFPPEVSGITNNDYVDKCQYKYAWVVLWNKKTHRYAINIPTLPLIDRRDDVSLYEFAEEMAGNFLKTDHRKFDIGAYGQFRTKYHVVITPNEDMSLNKFMQTFKSHLDTIEDGWMEERFRYEECLDVDTCKNLPIGNQENSYKRYVKSWIFDQTCYDPDPGIGGKSGPDPNKIRDEYYVLWMHPSSGLAKCPNGPGDPACFHIRSNMDKNSAELESGKKYEIILYDWESKPFQNPRVGTCGDYGGWLDYAHWCVSEDTGKFSGLSDPVCYDKAWTDCKKYFYSCVSIKTTGFQDVPGDVKPLSGGVLMSGYQDTDLSGNMIMVVPGEDKCRYKRKAYIYNDYALIVIDLEKMEAYEKEKISFNIPGGEENAESTN